MKTEKIKVLFVAFILIAALSAPLLIMKTVHAQNPVSISVEPIATAPLTDINASINGLETPPTPPPVGQNFTVEIHLLGATVTNVPNGISGVEIHFFFGNILNYCQVTGFTSFLGVSGGVLLSPLLYGINPGFYDANGSPVNTAPYTGAVYYKVAAASTGGPWNGDDGLIVKITFTITKQPQSSSGEPTVNLPLEDDFTDLVDSFAAEVTHDRTQGLLTIDATPGVVPASYTLTVNIIGNGNVTIEPFNATYVSGTVVTLTAIPDVNWTFFSWGGDLTGTQNPANITMNADKVVNATFRLSGPGIPGDLNHDGVVNLEDLTIFAGAWQSTPSSPNWNPECDLDGNGIVSLTDMVTFCVFYGSLL